MVDMLRPKRFLVEAGRRYPDAWQWVDQFRADRGRNLPGWPDWCFMPLAGAYAIVSRGKDVPPDRLDDVARLGALAAWRVTQGIYRFDTDLYQQLLATPIEGELPVEVLLRLPEWCLYIETPGYLFGADPLFGFFVHLEYDVNDGRKELRLLLDLGEYNDLIPVPMHLVGGIAESLQAMAAEATRQATRLGWSVPPDAAASVAGELVPYVSPLVSLVLYLCSQAAEYTGPKNRGPSRPSPVRTKRGPRLFPPDQPTVWLTGFRLGAALRKAREEHQAASEPKERRSPRPHIRSAHWHAYWAGPRSDPDKRRIILHWLPPIPVNMGDLDEIIPTIRQVKGKRKKEESQS